MIPNDLESQAHDNKYKDMLTPTHDGRRHTLRRESSSDEDDQGDDEEEQELRQVPGMSLAQIQVSCQGRVGKKEKRTSCPAPTLVWTCSPKHTD